MTEVRKEALRVWADEARATDRGALLLANLAHELDSKSIPSTVLRTLVEAVADCWLAAPGGSAVQVFRQALKKVGDSALCRGEPALDPPQRCSRVMTALDFFRHHIDLNAVGLIPDADVPAHAIQRLEKEGLSRLVKGTMKTAQPVVWVTDSQAIDSVRKASTPPPAGGNSTCEVASDLREQLGLDRYSQDELLLEIVYPPTLPRSDCPLRPPTLLEGIGSIYYRSKRTKTGWGLTVNLASGGDGLPEAVHPPVDLTADFRIRSIGRIRRNSCQVDYKSLAQRAPKQWNTELLEALSAYLDPPDDASN